jgi:putative PIN family toxin of toxin-antitoxin system
MSIYAVIDTNVIVSSLLTHDVESPTVGIIKAICEKRLVPLYSDYLLSEYAEVLTRSKFSLPKDVCGGILSMITESGIRFEPSNSSTDLPDPDDVPIYLIAMETRNLNSYLVTGNVRHFPKEEYIVTPKKMMELLQEGGQD